MAAYRVIIRDENPETLVLEDAIRKGKYFGYLTRGSLALLRKSKSEGMWGFIYLEDITEAFICKNGPPGSLKFASPTKHGAIRNAMLASRNVTAADSVRELVKRVIPNPPSFYGYPSDCEEDPEREC